MPSYLLFFLAMFGAASIAYAAADDVASGEAAFLKQVGMAASDAPVVVAATPAPTAIELPLETPAATAEPVILTPEEPEATPVETPVETPAATPVVQNPFTAPAPVLSEPPSATPAAETKTEIKAETNESFTQALAQTYTNNPRIKAQRELLKAVDEGVMQALSGMLPNAAAGYDVGRERLSSAHQDWNYGNANSKSLTVTQNLFNGGETYASFKAAKDRVKAGQAQLTALEQVVLFDGVVAYTDVVEKQSVLEVNQKNVDVLTKQLEATRARFEVGDITRTDVAQSEARLAKAKADERQALGDLDASRATYKRVIGVAPAEKLELPPLPKNLPENLNDASQLALSSNPDLESLRHLEKAAQTNVDVKTASLLPDVSLQGSMARTNGPSALSGARQLDNDALMLSVSIPLYQSGAEYSRIREAKNQAQQAKFSAMDTQSAVIENVDRAWQDYNTTKAVIVSSQEALDAAEVALEGIRQENQSGLRTILDVLDTEQEAFNARLNLVRAQRTEKTYAYRLLAAVGRLTAKDLGLPVSLVNPEEHYENVKYKLIGTE
ncbi:MAG: hypothetical protein EBR02_05345 [Alphaproteobacteria bacterium]|nr:hypothetical protein [Alphaproteobacteria bacterium]